MRFAYIDSQGKEVGIPSVEALQLRIELGAITAETIFFDASKDRWDPAGDHEIFRTLAREVRERGQAGPRPPTPKVEAVSTGEATAEGPDDGAERSRSRASDPFENEQDPLAEEAAEQDGTGWIDADLDELDEEDGPGEPEATPQDEGGDWDVDLEDIGSLELAPEIDEPGTPPPPESAEPTDPIGVGPSSAAGEAEEVRGETGLELEKPLSGQGVESPEVVARMEGLADDFAFQDPAEVEEVEDERPAETDVEGGMVGGSDVATDAGKEGDDDPSALPSGPPRRRDPYERRLHRPDTKQRPRKDRSVPRRRGRRPSGLIVGVVAVAAVTGGWLAWSALRGGEDGSEEAEAPSVVIPDLPAELEPAMRALADSTLSETLDSLRTMAAGFSLASEPNPDWLAGVYLANAEQYRDVVTYWETFRSYVDAVRGADEDIFLGVLRERLPASDVPPEARDTVFSRIRAGFQATTLGRSDVYDDLAELVDAATDLHEFLAANQVNIAYESAAGLSRDPVTEAIPSTPALGEEMWERVGRIPTALEGLGILDRVTTARILDVVFRRIGSVGVR
jgi:hypothetical protein